MKVLLVMLLCTLLAPNALADDRGPRRHGQGLRWEHTMQPLAPGGMSWQERQQLRDDLKSGRREGGRPEWRGGPRRGEHPPMPPEERERLRQDLREVNREMQRRR